MECCFNMLTLASRTVSVKVVVTAALVIGAGVAHWNATATLEGDPTGQQTRAAPAVANAFGALLGRQAPELKNLFAPVGTPDGMYDVYESAAPIERIAKALRALDADARPGAWDLQRLGAGDAFGAEGSYNRVQMALLVGGRRLTVARGSLRAENGALTAFTLISPYPDRELRELRSGTMTIVTRLASQPSQFR
jgi:hypothetical protein